MRRHSIVASLCLQVVMIQFFGCSSVNERSAGQYISFNSPEVLKEIRTVSSSVVGINALFVYRIETYRYEFINGTAQKDLTSPTGYKLLRDGHGITVTEKEHNAQGCGTILQHDNNHCLVLTSQHVLHSPDTLTGYYQDEKGRLMNLMSYRAVKIVTKYYVIDQNNKFQGAAVVHSSVRSDVALLRTDASKDLGREFPYGLAYNHEPDWGDPVYVFGYPQSIKQLTTAVISPSPYPGNFSIDGASRLGYSGGPVIVVRANGSLELIGIIRAIPATKIRFLSAPVELPAGINLIPEDIPRITIREETIVENNAAFVVGMKRIGEFLNECAVNLNDWYIVLSPRLLPEQ